MTHVSIVEGHEENRNLLKMLVKVNGYQVTVAGGGPGALAAAQPDPPYAIVSDVPMPNMDGFALCRLSCFPMRLLIGTRQIRRRLCISRIECQ